MDDEHSTLKILVVLTKNAKAKGNSQITMLVYRLNGWYSKINCRV